jgi:N-acetylglucosamine kinase-like BadF-type ATPase
MKLIADSGSTKTEWVLTDNGNAVKSLLTKGYNPYYFDKLVLHDIVANELLPVIGQAEVTEIYFYGAGCSTSVNNNVVKRVLWSFFPSAAIEVEHDLLGAARGLCGRQSGIACIMGTDSNSCSYDGNDILENVRSIGWMFGDKASGTHIGKSFIAAFLNNDCPKEWRKLFTETTGYDFGKILLRIYSEPAPNRFFAESSYFVGQHIEEPFMENIVRTSFREFFLENVCQYKGHLEVPVNCTGSVALVFEKLMKGEAEKLGLSIGRIIKSPTEGLITFHE